MQDSVSTEPKGIPLPAALAAVWGAFLYEGLLAHHPHPERMHRILDTWREGCIELVIAGSAESSQGLCQPPDGKKVEPDQ